VTAEATEAHLNCDDGRSAAGLRGNHSVRGTGRLWVVVGILAGAVPSMPCLIPALPGVSPDERAGRRPRNRVVRGGVEPPTFRFSGVPSPLGPRSHNHRDNPAHRHRCWSMGLQRHHSHCAAVCRVVPFRLWASRGEPSGSKDLWGFCGVPRRGWGTAIVPRADVIGAIA
jgi:hypothetical protein